MGVKITSQEPASSSEPAPSEGLGLGDLVEIAAKPFAKALNLQDCLPCQRRKARLNAMSARASSRVRRIFQKKA